MSDDKPDEVGVDDDDDDDEFEPIGSLIDLPLPLLMLQIFKAGLTGTLHLEGSALKTWLHFDQGRPDGVHDPNSEIFLGMVLREQGVLSDEDFNASLMKMAETGQLQGQVLVDMGAVTPEQIERALGTQQVRKASQLFSIKSATYRFDEDTALPARMTAYPISPYAVVYNGLLNCYADEELDVFLAPLTSKLCGAGPKLADFLKVVNLPEDERADLELLSQHRSPEDFANRASAGRTAARMLLLTLYWCDLLAISDLAALKAPAPSERPAHKQAQAKAPAASARPASQPQPQPQPKPGVPKLPAAIQKRLELKFKQASQGNLLALLEVRADASLDQIKTAFAGLAKIFHPDRFARFEDQEVSKQVGLIASRLNQAFETLSNPERRKAYLDNLVGGDNRPITLSPEAADKAYQKAKVYLQKKDLARALDSMRLACKLNPTHFGYRARLAWTEYEADPEQGPEQRQKLKRALLALRGQAPSNFWINRLLATTCQLLDQPEEYTSYLKTAAGIRPKDVDTARELRLLDMRKAKTEGKSTLGGLLGRRKS